MSGDNSSKSDRASSEPSAPGQQEEGYGKMTAAVFITSVSVGANLLNVPQAMSHLGWLGLPIIVILSLHSFFCCHLLSRCWLIVQEVDPALRGPVHKPYPLIAARALGAWASHLTSTAVIVANSLVAVMLLVLASDLVTSVVIHLSPHARPTLCLFIILMATFVCPFTWFKSPKNFWMVGVLGLTTSLVAWLLLLMKMCADFCSRAAGPRRVPPTPLHMMVGLSGVCSCYTTGGLLPTIQADMRDRADFTGAALAAWLLISTVVLSFGATSYTLIGTDVTSSVLHSLQPGKFLFAIQILMLLHTITSLVLYVNPVYQELEENLGIDEGGWQQYTLRTFCMGLMVLLSEALPDFGNVLDIISVLSVLTTFVLPPILYLRLADREGVDLKMRMAEKLLLAVLALTGAVYAVVAAYGTTAYVFAAQQEQGSCFQPRSRPTPNRTSTTPSAARTVIFQADVVPLKSAAATTPFPRS